MQGPGFIVLAYLAASTLWPTNDPFVGKWKLDTARSQYVDQMKVDAAGSNKYAFRFEGAPTETITADGTDQPGYTGTTLAATIEGPRNWKIVRKQGGRTIVSALWTLSQDGKTLRDAFTGPQPDGSTSTSTYVYRRTSGKDGFSGVRESTDVKLTSAYELEIRPSDGHALTFVTAIANSVKTVTFDGQDHAVAGGPEGATASGRRSDERALDITNRVKGQLIDKRAYKLSRDGKTLTITLQLATQTTPDVLVFERE